MIPEKQRPETEEVELLRIYRKNGKTIVTASMDADKLHIIGILTAYLHTLKEQTFVEENKEGWE